MSVGLSVCVILNSWHRCVDSTSENLCLSPLHIENADVVLNGPRYKVKGRRITHRRGRASGASMTHTWLEVRRGKNAAHSFFIHVTVESCLHHDLLGFMTILEHIASSRTRTSVVMRATLFVTRKTRKQLNRYSSTTWGPKISNLKNI